MYHQHGQGNPSNGSGAPMQPPYQTSRHQRSTSTPEHTDMMMRGTTAHPYQHNGSPMRSNQPSSGSSIDMFSSNPAASSYAHHSTRPTIRGQDRQLFQDYSPSTSSTNTHQQRNEAELIPPVNMTSSSCLSNTDLNSIERVPPAMSPSTITPFSSSHLQHPINPIASFGGSRSIEMKRPDSVITTSSIISSSDTEHSQAGDSSTESTSGGSSVMSGPTMMGPPSVYAMSGLYGASPVAGPSISSSGKPSHGKSPSSLLSSHMSRQPLNGSTQPNHMGLYPKTTAISSLGASSNEPSLSNSQEPNQQSYFQQHPKHQQLNSQQLPKFSNDPRINRHPNLAKSNSSSTATASTPFGRTEFNDPQFFTPISNDTTNGKAAKDALRGTKLEGRIRTISLQQSGNGASNDCPNPATNCPPQFDEQNVNGQSGATPFSINNPSCLIKRHRRQKSYPVTFQPINAHNVIPSNLQMEPSNDPKGYIPTEINYKSTNPNGGGIEDVLEAIEIEKSANSGTVVTLVRHGSNPINGHKRSHSYGPQRPSHLIHSGLNLQAQLGHRRAGSSVIETLQTLTGSCGHGDPNYNSKEASLAQFLEMLKKEQQEK